MQRRNLKTGRFVSKKARSKNIVPFDRNNNVVSAKEEKDIKPNELMRAKIVKAGSVAKHGTKAFVMTPVDEKQMKRDIAEEVWVYVVVGGLIGLGLIALYWILR